MDNCYCPLSKLYFQHICYVGSFRFTNIILLVTNYSIKLHSTIIAMKAVWRYFGNIILPILYCVIFFKILLTKEVFLFDVFYYKKNHMIKIACPLLTSVNRKLALGDIKCHVVLEVLCLCQLAFIRKLNTHAEVFPCISIYFCTLAVFFTFYLLW